MSPWTTSLMPVEGQFVAMWPVDGSIFSVTLMWEGGELLAYDAFSDDWISEANSGYEREFFEARDCFYATL